VAVPKKKKSKMKTRSHRAGAWKLACSVAQHLPALRLAKLPHTVCSSCGWYKDRVAVDVG
jgi:large subunit ribosomal protein L32